MADKTIANVHPLLRRPLYVYDLPPELLQNLRARDGNHHASSTATPVGVESEEVPKSSKLPPPPRDDGVGQSTSCQLCGTAYSSVQDQRQHAKSDFHRYNLKLGMKQLPAVDEATFVRMIGDLDESISGSDSSSSSADEADHDGGENDDKGGDAMLSTLLKRQAKLASSHQAETSSIPSIGKQPHGIPATAPLFWFSSSILADDKVLGIYKAIFPKLEHDTPAASLIDLLKKKQVTPTYAKNQGGKAAGTASKADPHYFLCMIGGGHFAAMIVSLVPQIQRGAGGVEERHPIVLAHKTFHRYTTRRKQGGSQSANDNAKGNAHSVGSSIRRANEAALELDVRNVLSEWQPLIDSADLLFVRATGSQNRRILFGPYDRQVLNSRDPRLRGFPFSTRRATQAELLRSFQELTRVKVSDLVRLTAPAPVSSAEEAAAGEEARKQQQQQQKPPKLSKEEEAAKLHTLQLHNLIRRSKAPGVLLYLEKNQLSPNFKFYPPPSPSSHQHHHAPTPLHLAAASNSAAVVSALLIKAKADPTVKNGDGKTAYEVVAGGGGGDAAKTREAFRIARHQLGEAAWDWKAASVPAAMSQAEADARAQRDRAEADALEAQRRQADLDKLRQQDELRSASRMERKAGAGRSLAAAALQQKSGADRREEDARGLTPEQRMRLERERRARAAEERFRRMQGS